MNLISHFEHWIKNRGFQPFLQSNILFLPDSIKITHRQMEVQVLPEPEKTTPPPPPHTHTHTTAPSAHCLKRYFVNPLGFPQPLKPRPSQALELFVSMLLYDGHVCSNPSSGSQWRWEAFRVPFWSLVLKTLRKLEFQQDGKLTCVSSTVHILWTLEGESEHTVNA